MLDHIMLRVKDYDASKRFYDEVLGTLGYQVVMEFDKLVGYGDNDKPYFWIGGAPDPHPRIHIAFMAKTRSQVDAFHAKALELGAKSDGAPGLRLEYHPNYYGTFVIDPDGHNIEAVIHTPEEPPRKAAQPAQKKTSAKKASAKKTSEKKASAKKAGGTSRRVGARKKAPARRGR